MPDKVPILIIWYFPLVLLFFFHTHGFLLFAWMVGFGFYSVWFSSWPFQFPSLDSQNPWRFPYFWWFFKYFSNPTSPHVLGFVWSGLDRKGLLVLYLYWWWSSVAKSLFSSIFVCRLLKRPRINYKKVRFFHSWNPCNLHLFHSNNLMRIQLFFCSI